jgi:hypothetical protein
MYDSKIYPASVTENKGGGHWVLLVQGGASVENAGIGQPFSQWTMGKGLTPDSGIYRELTCSHKNRSSANRESQRQQAAEREMSSAVLSEPHLAWLGPFRSRRPDAQARRHVASWRHIRSDGASLTR